jgi:hypothetical protein
MIPFVRGHRRKDSEAMATAFSHPSSLVLNERCNVQNNVAALNRWPGHLLPTGAADKLRRRD